jgi:hypothetical protein
MSKFKLFIEKWETDVFGILGYVSTSTLKVHCNSIEANNSKRIFFLNDESLN